MYSRYLQRQQVRSYESITKSVIAIGKLRDYYFLVCKNNQSEVATAKAILEDFLYAFDNGTVLGWKAASNQQYKATKRAVADYVKFSSEFLSKDLEISDREFIDICRDSYISSTYAEKSLLFHTKKRNKKNATKDDFLA